MSGQFFRVSITQRELDAVMNGLPGSSMTGVAHADVGWNAASRAVLTAVEAGNPPANRAGLPPHKYLEVPAMDRLASQWLYGDEGRLFCERLVRPANISKGLNGVGGAQEEWDLGRKTIALASELARCPVSIEIYKIDGLEIN